MSHQSEQVLEDQLVAQLQRLGYALVSIKDEKELIANLKTQLEIHNQDALTRTGYSAPHFSDHPPQFLIRLFP